MIFFLEVLFEKQGSSVFIQSKKENKKNKKKGGIWYIVLKLVVHAEFLVRSFVILVFFFLHVIT